VANFAEMVQKAVQIIQRDSIAGLGERVVITAGVPFGMPGNTNVLRIAMIEEPSTAT
ncbi:MAG: pyruvate kinase, partial [Proteobacteria bacterium]|nr:pyruvate kinase [Pseudomonadota bacterium]